MRVGINGMGRVGRAYLRRAVETSGVDVVAVNDVTDVTTLAHLLRYDSTFGPFPGEVRSIDDALVVGGHKIPVSSHASPEQIPWHEHGVDIVVEASGRFRTREAAAGHLDRGASSVIVSAPGKGVDATIVLGVNEQTYDPAHHRVISNASCTTNCVAPMVKVLHEAFGIERGIMTTVHAYTNDQNVLDAPHRDLRRARAAAVNIIPTSTGAAKAVGDVLPELAGRLDGVSLRVPVSDGSMVDLAVLLDRSVSPDDVAEAFQNAAAAGPLAGLLRYSEEPLVSSDVIGDPSSCVFDSALTQVSGRLVKVFGWYDNEWGYTCRLVDLTSLVAGTGAPVRADG
ncbi:MAG: type I glyceraldehyde-3-phosphate dehydrogenase [Nocardioides sp.]